MKFYAYIPTKTGNEPKGTDNRTLFEIKTIRGAIKRAGSSLNTENFLLFCYTNFYDDSTFKLLYDKGEHKNVLLYSRSQRN